MRVHTPHSRALTIRTPPKNELPKSQKQPSVLQHWRNEQLSFRVPEPCRLGVCCYVDGQVAGDNRPLYAKVEHYWFEVARNYEPLALQSRP